MSWRAEVEKEPWRYDLLAVLLRAEAEAADRPRIGDASTRREEYIDQGQEPHIAFPSSNVARFETQTESGKPRVRSRYLGMLGPMGPLPLSTTEEALGWYRQRDDAFVRFLDIFNNRFLQLFFRAFADARPSAHAARPDDRFAVYLGAAYGIGGPIWQNIDSLPDRQKLAFVGLLSPRSRSAGRLERLIAGMFGHTARVEEFSGSELELAEDERTRIGGDHALLGQGASLGSRVLSLDSKVVVVLELPDLDAYESFLPAGSNARKLSDAIRFALGPEYDWDVALEMPAPQSRPAQLGRFGRLGWTSWMGNPSQNGKVDRVGTRFSPLAL